MVSIPLPRNEASRTSSLKYGLNRSLALVKEQTVYQRERALSEFTFGAGEVHCQSSLSGGGAVTNRKVFRGGKCTDRVDFQGSPSNQLSCF